jgi:hypothetical protein
MPHNEEAGTTLRREFDRQIENLVQKRYPKVAGMTAHEFMKHITPLKDRIGELGMPDEEISRERIPFVIVVKSDLVPADKAMPLVDLNGRSGFIGMHPVSPKDFKPIESVTISDSMTYLLVDVDTGQCTRNVTPDEALGIITEKRRSPLTVDEGIALVTHHPQILRTHNCFSLLGSRRGDRRVTALWISGGRPRLGWCWAGNPHTWLGSASCAGRIGP